MSIVPLLSNVYLGLGGRFSRQLPTSVKKTRHEGLAFNTGCVPMKSFLLIWSVYKSKSVPPMLTNLLIPMNNIHAKGFFSTWFWHFLSSLTLSVWQVGTTHGRIVLRLLIPAHCDILRIPRLSNVWLCDIPTDVWENQWLCRSLTIVSIHLNCVALI